jgi:hypothetical protein
LTLGHLSSGHPLSDYGIDYCLRIPQMSRQQVRQPVVQQLVAQVILH